MSTEHILQCNQSEPLASGTRGRIVDLMNENDAGPMGPICRFRIVLRRRPNRAQ